MNTPIKGVTRSDAGGLLWHAEGVESFEHQDIVLQLVWPNDSTAPTAANQHQVQIAQDADGGPGEIIVSVGYVVPPNITPEQASNLQRSGQALQINPVSRFMVSRRQAEALMSSLREMITHWDQLDAQLRGGQGQ